MSDKTKNLKKQLDNIADEIGRSIISMPDEEVCEELIELGYSLEDSTSEVHTIFEASILQQKKRRFAKAKQQFQKKSSIIQKVSSKIDIQNIRKQFFEYVSQRPDLERRLTLQHRNLEELSDDTILGYMDDLNALEQLDAQDDDE